MRLFQRTYLWVVPDANSARKQGVGYQARILLVDNNCINNQQLTALWTLVLFQWAELLVVPDDNSAQKQGVKDRGRIWLIITVSTIINWHLWDVWAYTNGHEYGLCLMIIPHKIRGWNIGQDLVVWLIINVSTISNWHLYEVWAYPNRQKCGFYVMIILRKKRGWKIGQGFRK